MASQEDYLDNLLKDMGGTGEEPEDFDEPSAGTGEGEELLDLDAVSGMTEAEIENLLPSDNDGAEDFFGMSDDMLSDEDVLKMLEDSGDEDLKEIQDLLEKSDQNEAIEDFEGIDDLFPEDSPEKPEPSEGRRSASDGKKEVVSREEKESSAEKRERKKAEAEAKKAEKKAAKEAAKQAKAEKKAAKEAEAAAKKAEKQAAKGAAEAKTEKSPKSAKKTEDKTFESTEPAEERTFDPEDLTDMSLLDSILSEAKSSDKNPESQEGTESAEFFDIDAETREIEEPADFSFGEESMQEVAPEEGSSRDEESPELDLGDLFPETEDGLSGGEDSFSFSEDTLELDLEEADQLIPERGGASGGDRDGSGKKPLLSRIRDFLTEEDEEENEDLRLSQENQDILNDMKKESGGGGKKAKKGGAAKSKEKPKKAAKPKKQAKPKKTPAPKKQKEPKEAAPSFGKPLSFKKMLPVFLVGVSVGVLLFVFVNAAAEYSDKSSARTAFYQGDYDTCYQNLKGKKLDETESIMFGKSECILYSRLWVREYEVFTEKGDALRALESLIQAVDYYPDLQEKASRWNAQSEVAAGYAEILNLLESNFGLTESQAKEIASQRRDSDYTRMIKAIVEGDSFGAWSGAKAPGRQGTAEPAAGSEGFDIQGDPAETPTAGSDSATADPLPEEEGIGDDTFIENQ